MAIVIETCPVCGHDLIDIMIATNPPIPRKQCTHCSWSWEGVQEGIIRVPFRPSKDLEIIEIRLTPIPPSSKVYTGSPCETCGNNTLNGGSGICHCTLGLPEVR